MRLVIGVALGAGSVLAFAEPLALPISLRRGGCSLCYPAAATSPASRVKDLHRWPRLTLSLSGGMSAHAVDDGGIGERLIAVKERVQASQQNGTEVQLVAVSKFQSNDAILAAYAAGQRVFGENYVQELVSKAPELPADIRFHFIGMLQSNKAKGLVAGVPNLAVVESVHSIKTADALDKACEAAARPRPLGVMVQVLYLNTWSRHQMPRALTNNVPLRCEWHKRAPPCPLVLVPQKGQVPGESAQRGKMRPPQQRTLMSSRRQRVQKLC
jgi:hypothetical protein